MFDRQKVNYTYFEDLGQMVKCGTSILIEYRNVKNSLRSNTIDIIEGYLSPPRETEADYISPMSYFKISYSTTGPNAVPASDLNGNGVPDFVEWIANYLDTSWEVEITDCGFRGPWDTSGDGYYNISFQSMGCYGYTDDEGVDGNEGTRIVLHNNFLGFPPNQDPEGSQKGSAKVTCAHEFKHASQYKHSFWSEGGWVELDATWTEELVFDYVNDARLNFTGLLDPFSDPDIALDEGGSGSYEDYFWQDFLHQKFDNNSYTSAPLILAFWQRRQTHQSEPVLTTYDQVLQQFGSSLSEAFTEYIVWNHFTARRAVLDENGNSVFGYDEAGIVGFPEARLERNHTTYPVYEFINNTAHLASQHIRLNHAGNYALLVNYDGQDGVDIEAVVAWKRGTTVTWEKLNLDAGNDRSLLFPMREFGALLAIITETTGYHYGFSYDVQNNVGIDVAFTNKIGQSNAGGTFVVDAKFGYPIPSGEERYLAEGADYDVLTRNERFLNWSGITDYKHHDWNAIAPKYKLSQNFIASSENDQDANFNPMEYVTIQNNLIGRNGGSIDFHDPWYVDEYGNQPDDFITFSSPHYPKGKIW